MNRQRTEFTRYWMSSSWKSGSRMSGIWAALFFAALFAAGLAMSNTAVAAEADSEGGEVAQSGQVAVSSIVDAEAVEVKATADSKVAVEAKASSDSGLGQLFRRMVRAGEVADEEGEAFEATHRQVALLKISQSNADDQAAKAKTGASWGVKSFCLDSKDNLLVAVGNATEGELQLLNPAGERQQAWRLPVAPEAINVDQDGNFLVAGSGRMFKLDPQGEVLLEAESPLIAQFDKNSAALRDQVKQQMKSQAKSIASTCKIFQKMVGNIVAKGVDRLDEDDRAEYLLMQKRIEQLEESASNDELTVEEQNTWALRKILFRTLEAKVEKNLKPKELKTRELYNNQIKQFSEMASLQKDADPTEEQIDQAIESMVARKSEFASISAAAGEIFIATGATEGYGYDVWRFDENMSNATKVVEGLRGCCGQMDVQASEAGLFVAENSRHQVRHFDFAGEKLNEWGGREREGVRGFGSCCNPMNVAFGPDGTIYTAESNSGRIKRYSAEGKLMELIGSVELVPGCKKVSIAVTKDHKRVYMLDITRNHIIVMEANSEKPQVVSKDDAKNES